MKEQKLKDILEQHKLWLEDSLRGNRADLRYADLKYANLIDANLSDADLRYANLSDADLSYADLRYANLSDADLSYADLSDANLRYANLRYANLSDADLSDADLSGANLDFSQLNLSCKGLNFKIDERIAKQLVYHVINLMQHSELDTGKIFKKQVYKYLEDSHLVTKHNLPILKEKI